MSYAFRIRVSDMALFDPKFWTAPNPGPGKGQEQAKARRERFATRSPDDVWEISLDDDALDMISERLGLEGDGPGFTFQRYAIGGHREKSLGLSGSTLGDIGEILVWLTHFTAGRELVRVVGYSAWNPKGGGPFPQPDFLVWEGGIRALEVKTREALDYRALRDGKGTTAIAACDPLNEGRGAALPQIGFDPDDHLPISVAHHLKASVEGVHQILPFPCVAGVATIVLARDARVEQLRALHASGARTFRPKTPCTKRTCWACFDSADGPAHAAIVEMPNEPGRLLLPGPEGSADWLLAYARWGQAIRARDPIATRASEERLARSTAEWLPQTDGSSALGEWLHYLWSQYPQDVAYDRGLAEQRRIVELARGEWSLFVGQSSLPLVEEPRDLQSMIERMRGSGLGEGAWALDLRHDGQGSAVVVRSEDELRISLSANVWWEEQSVDSEATVAEIANVLWQIVREVTGIPFEGAPPMTPVVVRRAGDEREFLLGWAARPPAAGTDRRSWPVFWRLFSLFQWPPLLPPFRLHVTPDGRGVFSTQHWHRAL